jgi:predicted GNAT family acetyltransferase
VEIEVVNVPERRRYEARVDGVVAGFSAYNVRSDAIVFTHTEVLPEFEGKGVGSAMARGVLDDVRAAGGAVVPLCPFIAAYIRGHDEYRDLIVARFRSEFDAAAAG